jgi:flagellar motor switch protein FliM
MTTFPVMPQGADHVLVASPSCVLRQRVLDSLPKARRIEQAHGGAEALVHLERGCWQLLLLDRRLPDLDAEELSQTVRTRFLRVVFDCSLVSVEHLTYREFLQRIPERTYLASCDLAPFGAIAILQLDLGIAFLLIDVLLGGEGKSGELTRELTEIEEQVLEGIIRIICRDLKASWQAINLEFNFGAYQQVSQAYRLMPPDEKNLCLSFEVKMSDTRGTLNLAVPALVSNALLRKISADISYQRPHSPVEARQQIQRRLLECPFVVELSLPHLNVAIEELSKLVPGDTLSFPRAANTPAILQIDGVPLCSATPVRVNAGRAARVLAVEVVPASGGENTKRESS